MILGEGKWDPEESMRGVTVCDHLSWLVNRTGRTFIALSSFGGSLQVDRGHSGKPLPAFSIIHLRRAHVTNGPKWQVLGWSMLLPFRIVAKMFLETGVGNGENICKCIFCLVFWDLIIDYHTGNRQKSDQDEPRSNVCGVRNTVLSRASARTCCSLVLSNSLKPLSFHFSVQSSL